MILTGITIKIDILSTLISGIKATINIDLSTF